MSTLVSAEEETARRADAIATSGWGAPFRFVQPHNACFWVYLLLVVAGLWYLVLTFASTAGLYAEANAAAIITSAVFAAVFLYFLWSSTACGTPPPH